MKSKIKRRIIALMLCLTMVLNGSVPALADDGALTDEQQVVVEEQVEGEAIEEVVEDVVEVEATEEVVEQTDVIEEVVETAVEENETALTWSEDGVTVTVSEKVAGAIPEGATLSVTPIVEGDEYTDVETQLQEKAASEEYEIAGFLAYDICLVDADGNEIEPNDNVNVSIEYDEAVIPEMEVAEDVALDVTVMHFEEDKNGEVAEIVDMVAEEEIEAAVTTTEAVEVEKVEFVTDSFSTYTITWTSSNQESEGIDLGFITIPGSSWNSTITVNIMYVNSLGETLTVTDTAPEQKEVIDLNDYKFDLSNQGYYFSKAIVGNISTGQEITSLKFTDGSGSGAVDNVSYLVPNGTEYTLWLSTSSSSQTASGTVYMVYGKAISIENRIASQDASGQLRPILNGSLATVASEAVAAGKTVLYKWYKDIGDGYVQSERERYGDDVYSLAEDGSWINIVLDGGALSATQTSVKYKVEVYIDGTLSGTSDPFEIPYWDELQNGSFETPNFDDKDAMQQFANDSYKDFIWKTTGEGTGTKEGKDIEVLNTTGASHQSSLSGSYAWKTDETPNAADGVQFAELNCEASGSLYQDVLTVAGKELNYWFSHRARGTDPSTTEEDTMYVVIVPSHIAMNGLPAAGITSEIDTQAEVTALISYINAEETAANAAELGLFVESKTSDDQSWHAYQGTYTATSYLTRFFFVAGATASGNNTVGNFLDYVGFSQDLPPASPGTFEIRIEKTISGLSNSEYEALKERLTFTVSATKAAGTTNDAPSDGLVISANDENFVWVDNDDGSHTGTYILTCSLTSLSDKYTYTVTEGNEVIDGYQLTTTIEVAGDKADIASAEIKERSTVLMSFTNKYAPNKVKNINFTKIWDDFDNYFNTRPSTLTIQLIGYDKEGNALADYTYDKISISADENGNWTHVFENVPVYYLDSEGVRQKITWDVIETSPSGYQENVSGVLYNSSLRAPLGSYSNVDTANIPTPMQVVMAMSILEDEAIETYGVSPLAATTYARPGQTGSGSSSSTTFNHIDIQADGSYSFTYNNIDYTVVFDFYEEEWKLYKSSDMNTVIQSGALDVKDFIITNKTTGADITTSGSWQSSNVSGQSYEYRISGTFTRTHIFNIHFEIPIVLDGVTINLISDFDTSYDDTVYNVCPTGGGHGIDIELDSAIDQSIQFNVLALNKTFTGLAEGTEVPETTFTITSSDGSYTKTVSYEEFSEGFSGSTSISAIPAGTYTVTENVGTAPTGYTENGSTVQLNSGTATAGKSITFTIEQGTINTVSFVNDYISKHTITMQKVWVDSETTHPTVTLTATLSDGTTWTENAEAGKVYSKSVDADVTIESIKESTSIDGYVTTTSVSDTAAVVINTASSMSETTATIVKAWDDEDDKYEKRPASIQVQLYQVPTVNGVKGDAVPYGDVVTITAENNWTYTFTDLEASVTSGGTTTTYSYYVKELNVPSGYSFVGENNTVNVTGGMATLTNRLDTAELDESFTIVNSLITHTIKVNKYWNDDGDTYNSRPDSITLNIVKDGVTRSAVLGDSHDSNNKWTAEFVVPASYYYDETTGTFTYQLTETLPEGYGSMYDITYNGPDSNNELSIVNTPNTTDIQVTKIWVDASNKYSTRPTSISFKIQWRYVGTEAWTDYDSEDEGTDVDVYVMNSTECADPDYPDYWYYSVVGLPLIKDNKSVEYQVVEIIDTENNPALAYYNTSYPNAATIANVLNTNIVKVSATDTNLKLGGAIFKLESKDHVYYGQSSSEEATKGLVTWYSSYADGTLSGEVDLIADGTYSLSEIVAPAGYTISDETWTVVADRGLIYPKDSGDKPQGSYLAFEFTNEPLYELPSSGGFGIYVYMFGGMMLMAFATFVLYKNRRKEVLAR